MLQPADQHSAMSKKDGVAKSVAVRRDYVYVVMQYAKLCNMPK